MALLNMKRAQLKMGESFAVLVVFFILLAIGLIFYSTIQRTSVKEQQEESLDKKAIHLAQAATFLPEIQCSRNEEIAENCFDLYKLMAIVEVGRDPATYLSYRELFGNSRIQVQEVYPGVEDPADPTGPRLQRVWDVYDAALPNETNQYTTRISTFIPIALKNESVRPETHSFGYLNVTLYG